MKKVLYGSRFFLLLISVRVVFEDCREVRCERLRGGSIRGFWLRLQVRR